MNQMSVNEVQLGWNKERMMDLRQTNSITGVGSPAAARVSSSLTPHPAATSKTVGGARPMAVASSAGAAADSSDITSSDFLTLLVSELQNQDPTQPADPNAYISQLVGVNSLQQLIQINEGLASVETPPSNATGATGSSGSATNAGANAITATNSVSGAQSAVNQNSIWRSATSS
jgi:flagellar basal-body rod modification protein FlgD